MGLVGLAYLTIVQSTKEIGIRKVMGATVKDILFRMNLSYLRVILLGLIIGFPLAWVMVNLWLSDFAYKVNIGLVPFILTGITVLVTVIICVSSVTVKTALRNPVKSLKYE